MNILVIDDKANDPKHSRTRLLNILREQTKIEFDIVPPNEEALKPKLRKIDSYDLIVVDYKFDQTDSPIFKTGASLHSLLRDYTKSVPIYLISVLTYATNKFGEFDLFIKDEFISDHISFKKEIEDHNLLRNVRNTHDIIELLRAPNEVQNDFNLMLAPILTTDNSKSEGTDDEELLPTASQDNTHIRLFRWLIQTLFYKEGPLVDVNGAALRLGISKSYFESICERFELAKYNGIFNHSHRSLWWSCLLEDYVLELEDEQNFLSKYPFLEAAPILLGATTPEKQSKCIVCSKRYPDSLGIIVEDDEKSLYQVHIACSELNDSLKQEPFFKNPRIIDGE